MSLPDDSEEQRRLLDDLGAPPGPPVFEQRACCDEHGDWTVQSIGLEYDDESHDDDELLASLGSMADNLARGWPWVVRATGPGGESVEVRPSRGETVVSVSAPHSAPPSRYGWLRGFADHVLRGVPYARPGRPRGAVVSHKEIVDALVKLARPGHPPTQGEVASELLYSEPAKLRAAFGSSNWHDLCVEASRQLRPTAEELSTTPGAVERLRGAEALLTAASRGRG